MNATTAAMMLFIQVLSAMTSSISVTALATCAAISAQSAWSRPPALPNKNIKSRASMPSRPTIASMATIAAPTLPAANAALETESDQEREETESADEIAYKAELQGTIQSRGIRVAGRSAELDIACQRAEDSPGGRGQRASQRADDDQHEPDMR